ncbi:MAG TPA: ACT domain-containing protein [Puia sp.]|nr:ACT domain-containing protein [Puia sp.]
MPGESDLNIILKTLKPFLHEGEYVFCQVPDQYPIDLNDIICYFRESEGITIILSRTKADQFKLPYSFVSSWITLRVHSSLESVGLTAAFSNVLSAAGISCNVVAAFFHDHIFVDIKDARKAMDLLEDISKS